MRDLNAIIIDDERLAVAALQDMLGDVRGVHLLGHAADADSGLVLLASRQPDLVFLDIGMPGMDGIELARMLRRMARPPLVILVTAHADYGAEAYDCAVLDYVLKPVQLERLQRACERAAVMAAGLARSAPPPDDLWVPHLGSVVRLPLETVVRMEAERDYVRVHTAGRSYLMRTTLNALEARLDARAFVRIHRSTIIPLGRVRSLRHGGGGRWAAVDLDGRADQVGRSYLAAVRARLGITADEASFDAA